MTPDPRIALAFEATWPAAEFADSGALRSGRGLGAGGRVSSTRALSPHWTEADISAAEAVHHGWQQRPMFRVTDTDRPLQQALAARGYMAETPTAILSADLGALDISRPRMTTFDIWPPLEIQRTIWAAGNINPARQAVMDRVTGPRTAILGRLDDRAAGAGFVALHGDVAMIHALEVLSDFRRRGLARHMMRAAAEWAKANGASHLALAVSRPNVAALALYTGMGFQEVGGYGYWAKA
ncbi:GNAT family N-acetyltransferase [Paracoccus laeviglucosivorans]|uniref:Acetyltransferase (GNAT) family protein n=1 Tax=Paracoccus laeviglucosivorans TaxID=1197861 RepID=A0A521E6C1_9RHOB|nr:GNAT family N-acetyltransferase [Paracoccus laeviglucosivorans]SMO79435.1 Acetyltransferase (GNAT) family protein [Paracoccus laeviglucosivorans]